MTTFVARTHVGYVAGNNEDALGGSDADALWFVSDGLGGHAAGQVASGIVKDLLLAEAADPDTEAVILRAHQSVLSSAAEHEEYRGMGATVVTARILRGICTVTWVGDSRAYLWRRDTLRPLTRDHSFREEIRDQGLLTDTQIDAVPQGRYITRSLGQAEGDLAASTTQTPLRRGDRILLCSDGLHDEVPEREIASVLADHRSLEAAADALVEAALEKGGRDNVSVLLVAYDGPSVAPLELSRRSVAVIAALSGVAAAALAALAWLRLRH